MQGDDDMKCELRVDYEKLPGVVERTKGSQGCCAAALYSLEPCEEKGLVRAYLLSADKCATKKTALYCWENCPGDWGENHEGAKDEDVPLCLCAGHLKTFVDRGGTAGRYPKLFVTPTKRERELEQEVEALRLSIGIAASLKPSADGSLAPDDPDPIQNQQDGRAKGPGEVAGLTQVKVEPEEAKKNPGAQAVGRNPPEGRDGAGVPYGGTRISDYRCWCLDGRELPVWITGERMGYAFGVEAGPGEFLFVARCTGEAEVVTSAGGVQSPAIELYFRYFDRVVRMPASEAAAQLAHTIVPLQTIAGIRSAGSITVTAEDEGWSVNRERHFTEVPDVVGGVNASRPGEVSDGDEVAARQKEFLTKIRGDPEGTQSPFKAVEPMEGQRSALGALNSAAGVRKLSKELESAVDQMAGMDRDPGGFCCPTYSEISMSPEGRGVRGRSSPAVKMQVGGYRDFSSVGAMPFDAVGGMPTARGGPLRTLRELQRDAGECAGSGPCAWDDCMQSAVDGGMWCELHLSCICLEPGCNKKAAEGQGRCSYHLQWWLQQGAKRCARHPTCAGVLLPGVKTCPICRSVPFKVAGTLVQCASCTEFYRHDPDRAGECTVCGHQHGSRGSEWSPGTPFNAGGGDQGGYGADEGLEADPGSVAAAIRAQTLAFKESLHVQYDAFSRLGQTISGDLKAAREDKEKATEVYPTSSGAAIKLLRTAANHGGTEAVGDGLVGRPLAQEWMNTANLDFFTFKDDMTPLKARALSTLELGMAEDPETQKLVDCGGVGYGDFRTVSQVHRELEVAIPKMATKAETKRVHLYRPPTTLKELEECALNLFCRLRYGVGKIYESLFKISLERKKDLHERDPWRYTEFRLCRYADIELLAWCRRVKQCAGNYETFRFSDEEFVTSRRFGFSTVPLITTSECDQVFVRNFERKYYFERAAAMERMVQSGRAGRSVRVQPALPRAGGDDFSFDDVLYPQGCGEGMPDAGGALAVMQWDDDMEESVEDLPQAGGGPETLHGSGELEEYADLLQEHGLEDDSCLPEGGGRRSRIIRTSLDPAKPPAGQQVQQAALHGGGLMGPPPAGTRDSAFQGSTPGVAGAWQGSPGQAAHRGGQSAREPIRKPTSSGGFAGPRRGDMIPRFVGAHTSVQKWRGAVKQLFISKIPMHNGRPVCVARRCWGGCHHDPSHPAHRQGSVCTKWHPQKGEADVPWVWTPEMKALAVEFGGHKDPSDPAAKFLPHDLEARQRALDFWVSQATVGQSGASQSGHRGAGKWSAAELTLDVSPCRREVGHCENVAVALKEGFFRIRIDAIDRVMPLLDLGAHIDTVDAGPRDFCCLFKTLGYLYGVPAPQLLQSVQQVLRGGFTTGSVAFDGLLRKLKANLLAPEGQLVPLDVFRLMGELFRGAPLVCYQDAMEGLRVYVFRCLGDDAPVSFRECVLTDQHMMPLGTPSFPGRWQSLASFLASLRVAGVEVREAWAVPGLGMRPNGISGEAVTRELVAGGLQSGMLPDLGLTDRELGHRLQSGMLPDLGLTDRELGHLLLFDRDDGGPLAPVDISVIEQAGFESFHVMGPGGVAMPTSFTGLKVGQEVLPEIDPALWEEDDWMNTLVPEQMDQDDSPEMKTQTATHSHTQPHTAPHTATHSHTQKRKNNPWGNSGVKWRA